MPCESTAPQAAASRTFFIRNLVFLARPAVSPARKSTVAESAAQAVSPLPAGLSDGNMDGSIVLLDEGFKKEDVMRPGLDSIMEVVDGRVGANRCFSGDRPSRAV